MAGPQMQVPLSATYDQLVWDPSPAHPNGEAWGRQIIQAMAEKGLYDDQHFPPQYGIDTLMHWVIRATREGWPIDKLVEYIHSGAADDAPKGTYRPQ